MSPQWEFVVKAASSVVLPQPLGRARPSVHRALFASLSIQNASIAALQMQVLDVEDGVAATRACNGQRLGAKRKFALRAHGHLPRPRT